MNLFKQAIGKLFQWLHVPVTDYYTEERCIKSEEEQSPSGRTRLLIRRYKTKEGGRHWNYSRGTLYQGDKEISDIKRNYPSFHRAWVTKDGQEYFISGRSYMNQCIVNCDTGQEKETSDFDLMKKGVAFCWAHAWLTPDGNTLVVDGCFWACPYEFKFFDFSDPMSTGWPELVLEGTEYVSAYEIDPTFNEDGTITTLETENGKPDGELEERLTLRRQGNSIVVVDKWQSKARKAEELTWDQ